MKDNHMTAPPARSDNPALAAALKRLVTTHKLLTRHEGERLAVLLGITPSSVSHE